MQNNHFGTVNSSLPLHTDDQTVSMPDLFYAFLPLGGVIMTELDYQKIGSKIRAARLEKGWSQDKLSEKCNISLSFMGHIERGTRIMSLETFVSLCNELEISADHILWDIVRPSDPILLNILNGVKTKDAVTYSNYVRIIKAIAEIMSDAC